MERRSFPVYGKREPPLSKVKEVDSRRTKLSSSMMKIGKKRKNPERTVKAEMKSGCEKLRAIR